MRGTRSSSILLWPSSNLLCSSRFLSSSSFAASRVRSSPSLSPSLSWNAVVPPEPGAVPAGGGCLFPHVLIVPSLCPVSEVSRVDTDFLEDLRARQGDFGLKVDICYQGYMKIHLQEEKAPGNLWSLCPSEPAGIREGWQGLREYVEQVPHEKRWMVLGVEEEGRTTHDRTHYQHSVTRLLPSPNHR